jgi:NhaP-type Na+/H+ or K+/H+ antiporter
MVVINLLQMGFGVEVFASTHDEARWGLVFRENLIGEWMGRHGIVPFFMILAFPFCMKDKPNALFRLVFSRTAPPRF